MFRICSIDSTFINDDVLGLLALLEHMLVIFNGYRFLSYKVKVYPMRSKSDRFLVFAYSANNLYSLFNVLQYNK